MPLSINAAQSKDKRAGIPEMQHRHFAFMAETIATSEMGWTLSKANMAKHFADVLARSNPRFDRERFMRACGAI